MNELNEYMKRVVSRDTTDCLYNLRYVFINRVVNLVEDKRKELEKKECFVNRIKVRV